MMRLPKYCIFFFCVCIVVAAFFFPPTQTAHAALTCTASVSPSSIAVSTTTEFTFTINNTSSVDDISWIKVTRPSSNFTLGGFTSLSGWGSSIASDTITLTYGTVGPESSMSFGINVTSGSSEAPSANWTVQTSDNEDGADAVSCSGSLGTAISGAGADTTAPTISNIVVSNISDTQATISWTTDESATSVVDYGTTDEYGSSATGDTGTSHSVAISSLTANTTYHYNVRSVDGSSNEGESGDNTFTTAVAGTTTTTTVTGTTTTRTVTATPTPTPIPDRTPPKTTIETKFDKPFTEAPTITGKATDPSGVDALEYSLDDGRTFAPITEVEGLGKSTATFAFTPFGLLDDNYIVKIRATDEKGNTGVSKGVTMVIDRLPPLAGGLIVTLGPQVLDPERDGSIRLLRGVSYRLILSAVGGPTEIQLVADDKVLGTLTKNLDNGLWSTTVQFDESGTYTLGTKSVDGAQNRKDKTLLTVVVSPGSVVTDGGTAVTNGAVWVYYLDKETKRFVVWDGASYDQQNPISLDAGGSYAAFLPAGTYYLRVRAPGYQDAVSQIFTLDKAYPVSESVSLTRKRAIKIGSWLIPLPDFRETQIQITLKSPQPLQTDTLNSRFEGKEFPYFSLPMGSQTITTTALRGKPTVVTLLNSWLPTAASQLAVLNDIVQKQEINVVAILPQETAGRVAIFAKRGGYAVPLIADPDGTLIEAMTISSMPVHMFLNRKGSVVSVRSGMLTKEELLDEILRGI